MLSWALDPMFVAGRLVLAAGLVAQIRCEPLSFAAIVSAIDPGGTEPQYGVERPRMAAVANLPLLTYRPVPISCPCGGSVGSV